MIPIIADTHTHTLICDHAYSTLAENVAVATRKGLKALVTTEHGPAMEGGPSALHFTNMRILPRYINGILILRGIEANIMDFKGAMDLEERHLVEMEWVIASYHIQTIKPGTEQEHTLSWMHIANNPHVDVIGHCGDPRYSFDFKPVIQEFGRNGKIVEINAHSFVVRHGSAENCKKIALLCAEYNVPVVVSSDAHYCEYVGYFDRAVNMLEEIGFPQELIVNSDYDRFIETARRVSGKRLTDE